jgi:poly(A) polymerase
MDHAAIFDPLISAGYPVRLHSFSALDSYMELAPLPFTVVETDADIPVLARLLEGLRFPGVDIADGAVDSGGQSWYFRCVDPDDVRPPSYAVLSLSQDWTTKRFRDPHFTYPLLREIRDGRHENKPASAAGITGPASSWWTGLNPGAG